MGFVEAVKTCFTKYATFTGRATRSEYWWFYAFYLLADGLVMGICQSIDNMALSSVFSLAIMLPSLAVAVRRLHDINKSGWALLWGLIPVIGWILLIVWFIKASDSDNQYGPAEA